MLRQISRQGLFAMTACVCTYTSLAMYTAPIFKMTLQIGAPDDLGSAEGDHPDLFRFPRFLPICSDLRSLFPGMPRFVPICSVFFQFVPAFRTNQNKLGKPLSADPFCKSPIQYLISYLLGNGKRGGQVS